MKKFILFILMGILLTACSTLEGDKKVNLEESFNFTDMVSLDKSYVPALYLTNKDEREKSKLAIAELKEKWSDFKTDNYTVLNNKQKERFNQISEIILKAEEIAENEDVKLVDAHEELESIREILYEIRAELGIDYYMDELTAFHTAMEETIEAKGNIAELKAHLPNLKIKLDDLENFEFDAKLYQLNETQNAKRLEYISNEKKAILNLEKAIQNDKLNEKVVLGIKPNFIKLFLIFGNKI